MRKFYSVRCRDAINRVSVIFPSILFLLVFLTSCSTYLRTQADEKTGELQNKRQIDVIKLYTNNDGLVYFSNRYPGKLINGEVTGVKHIPLRFFNADSVVYRVRGSKEIPRFAYSSGQKFDIFCDEDLTLVYTTSLIMVPVSEINDMVIRKNGNRTLAISGLVAGISALSIYIISNMSFDVNDAF